MTITASCVLLLPSIIPLLRPLRPPFRGHMTVTDIALEIELVLALNNSFPLTLRRRLLHHHRASLPLFILRISPSFSRRFFRLLFACILCLPYQSTAAHIPPFCWDFRSFVPVQLGQSAGYTSWIYLVPSDIADSLSSRGQLLPCA
ncbi:hypothetical protein BDV59DRAFT_149514 [Aspergillus ambiguus]|uniref:uncharacterized protein n=1 Tax=Aspergillus ambiguus TaxID=176160 RepID=UPI003CCC9B12